MKFEIEFSIKGVITIQAPGEYDAFCKFEEKSAVETLRDADDFTLKITDICEVDDAPLYDDQRLV